MRVKQGDQAYFESRKKKAKIIIKELEENANINSQKVLNALEVGCNHGFITYHISQLTKWKMTGGDIDDNIHKYKKKFRKHITINFLDATKMPYKNDSFDVVILNHVLEHVPQWEQAINEIYRVLKKGGVLYLATPNKYRKIPHLADGLGVTLRVLFRNKSKIKRAERMQYHMGFSAEEVEKLLSEFSEIKCLNKKHFVTNVPAFLKGLFRMLPYAFYKKRAQTCLFIAKK